MHSGLANAVTLDVDRFPAVSGKLFCSASQYSLSGMSPQSASPCEKHRIAHRVVRALWSCIELTSITNCEDHEELTSFIPLEVLEVSFGKAKCVCPCPTGTTTNEFRGDVALLLSISEHFASRAKRDPCSCCRFYSTCRLALLPANLNKYNCPSQHYTPDNSPGPPFV